MSAEPCSSLEGTTRLPLCPQLLNIFNHLSSVSPRVSVAQAVWATSEPEKKGLPVNTDSLAPSCSCVNHRRPKFQVIRCYQERYGHTLSERDSELKRASWQRSMECVSVCVSVCLYASMRADQRVYLLREYKHACSRACVRVRASQCSCVSARERAMLHAPCCGCGSQRTTCVSQFPSSPMWGLGTELRLSGLGGRYQQLCLREALWGLPTPSHWWEQTKQLSFLHLLCLAVP